MRRLRLAQILALGAVFLGSAGAHNEPIAIYPAASQDKMAPVAPDSVVFLDGEFEVGADSAGPITVRIEGADGVERLATVLAVSSERITILLPSLPDGSAHAVVSQGGEAIADGQFLVARVSPGLFSAAGTGGGWADGSGEFFDLRNGSWFVQSLTYIDSAQGKLLAVPMRIAAGNTIFFLKLRASGVRHAGTVTVTVDGVNVPAICCLDAPGMPGVDEVVVGPLPLSLAWSGAADVVLVADGASANVVQVAFGSTTGQPVTFSNQIVRLFQGHCQECHRPGEVAPFSLLEYEDAKLWSHSIRAAVEERRMPPWKPVAGHGEFLDERRLTDEEIDLVRAWVDTGAPEGDPSDMPEPLVFNQDWALGEPDLILETPEFTPDPEATDVYRCFSIQIPESITESKSITSIEIRPGDRGIVHHVILYGDPVGESQALEAAADDGLSGYECFGSAGISFSGFTLGVESYLMGGWAPGAGPMVSPEDTGIYLRRGAHVSVQVHYHPDGTARSDRTRIGLHFAPERTPNNATIVSAINTNFVIPAGAKEHVVTATFRVQSVLRRLPPVVQALAVSAGILPLRIRTVLPHMHQLGREIRMDKVSATGERTPMIYIDDWDFDWQDFYRYVEPVSLGLDDTLEVRAVYDNSAENPNNPNSPPIDVGWGDRTQDEMCIVFFTVDVPDLCRLPLGLCSSH